MDTRDLYLLQDGTQADPADVSPDEKGVLRHKNGLAVCMSEDGKPQTVGKNAETSGSVVAANAGKDTAVKPGELPLAPAARRPADIMRTGDQKPAVSPAHEPKAG